MDSIKDIIPQVVEKMVRWRSQRSGGCDTIEQVWENILEEQELRHTRLIGPRDGKLFIAVDAPAWVYHLRMRKTKILRQLQKEIPEIQDILFKVGAIK